MPTRYVGITDFTKFVQVQCMLRVFRRHLWKHSKLKLAVGVMMSRKTLRGLPTRWAAAFPANNVIADIFGLDTVLNCLHYADYRSPPDDLVSCLTDAIGWGGIGIRAVQLDMTWPDPGQVAHAVHTSRKTLEVILQVGTTAFEDAGNEPQEIANRLRDYETIISHVLLDRSVGQGIPLEPDVLLPFIRVIRQEFPALGIVVAGGLGPGTLGALCPILAEFPEISIDAQGRLRPSGNSLDRINWEFAKQYLIGALGLLR
jgi:hypothetical protein